MKQVAYHPPTAGCFVDADPRWDDQVAGKFAARDRAVSRPAGARCASGSVAGPVRLVTVLAFCQVLAFVAMLLWVCSLAGAATTSASETELRSSSFEPVSQRDPFLPKHQPQPEPVAAVVAAPEAKEPAAPAFSAADFRLNGILFEPANPAAIVNDRLITLNKIVTLDTPKGAVRARALAITRERVTLEVGGERLELRMDTATVRSP
jgi:hypothetical protein